MITPISNVRSNLQSVWQSFTGGLSGFWHARQAREQSLILIAGIFTTASLVYLFVLSPALEGAQRLKTSLPALQAQLGQVQQLSASIQQNPAAKNTVTSANSIQNSLANAGLVGKVSPAAPWIVTFDSVPSGALFQWLKQTPSTAVQLKLLESGLWQGEVTLEN